MATSPWTRRRYNDLLEECNCKLSLGIEAFHEDSRAGVEGSLTGNNRECTVTLGQEMAYLVRDLAAWGEGGVVMPFLGYRAKCRLGSGVAALSLLGVAAGYGLTSAQSASAVGASSAPGVTATSITIGDDAALSGTFASNFSEENTAFMAAVDAQNARGGVYGRKIDVITEDNQSSPSADLTVAQSLVEAKGVFMLAQNTALAGGRSR
jgi:hypothetical protein